MRPQPEYVLPVIVPLAPDPRGSYEELRYSLRALEEYGKGVGTVTVLGPERPHWCSPFLGHMPFPARAAGVASFTHVRRKLEWVCTGLWAPPWWILWNDDFFPTEPFRTTEVGIPCQPHLSARVKAHDHRQASAPFVAMLRATAAWLEELGADPAEEPDYLVHRPLLVHSRTMLAALAGSPEEVSPRAAYGRAAIALGIGPVHMAGDCKVRNPPGPRDPWPRSSAGFWSSDDAFCSARGRQVLQQQYPTRSRWEEGG